MHTSHRGTHAGAKFDKRDALIEVATSEQKMIKHGGNLVCGQQISRHQNCGARKHEKLST
jgi:hypothetical protein